MFQDPQITESLLTKAVNKYIGSSEPFEFEKVQITSGSKEGDGFVCEMKEVDITIKLSRDNSDKMNIHFMAKCIPSLNEDKAKFIRKTDIFQNEFGFYTSIAPDLEKVLESVSAPKLKIPQIYGGSMEQGVLLLENLKMSGFEMQHCKQGKDSVQS